MKKIIITFLLLSIIMSQSINVLNAQEPPEPYMVTQDINYESVPLEDCLILLENTTSSNESTSNVTSMSEVEEQLNSVQVQYNDLNNMISELESGESDSIDWANSQLTIVIDAIYLEMMEFDEVFPYLTEEEQFAIVSNHEAVIEWQAYIQEIQGVINQLIADRNQLEQSYANLNYQYEALQSEQEIAHQSKALQNQCQIYPYSAEYISIDQVMLNYNSSLNDYLVQIDNYLQKLIAKPYRKVSFDDIYRLFAEQLDATMLEEAVANKPNIVLDNLAIQEYSYAKELSLLDIETMSQYAQRAYIKDNSKENFIKAYQQIIQIKENQIHYMHRINSETIEYIKEDLANYLNSNGFNSADEIELVRSLHQRYQVKLVLFDEYSQLWQINEGSQSGYYDEFMVKELANNVSEEIEDIDESDSSESLSGEENNLSNDSMITDDETINNQDESNDNLDTLKDQLLNVRNNTNVKDLPKPNLSKNKESDKESTNKSSGSKNIELPSTGERQPLTLLAITILIIGIIILITSSYLKRQKRDNNKMDLE